MACTCALVENAVIGRPLLRARLGRIGVGLGRMEVF